MTRGTTRSAPVAGLAGAGLVSAALWSAWASPWTSATLAERAGEPTGLAPGTDFTLVLAGLMRGIVSGLLPTAAASALWTASWLGAATLFGVALLAGRRRPLRGAAIALAVCLNPLALGACASGFGLGALGIFVLAVQMIGLEARPLHRGLPLLGGGLTLAAACVPGATALALPIFAVLFLGVPAPWDRGTMRSVYLAAFAMPAAWLATSAYLAARAGLASAAPLPSGPEDLWHLGLGAALAAACAPGLLARGRRRPSGIALVLLSALAFVATGVPDTLAVWIAWSGQAAAALRYGGAGQLSALAVGTLSSAGATVLLV